MFEKLFDTVIENMLGRMTLEEKAYALTPLDNQYCSIPSQDFYGPTPQDVPAEMINSLIEEFLSNI